MTLKESIIAILEEGETDYGNIEDRTGATRSYIRTVAHQYRKGKEDKPMVEETQEPTETPVEETEETPEPQTETLTIKPEPEPKRKYKPFDEWLKERKYECGNCGWVISKQTKFCPNCGLKLDWEAI